MGTTALGAARDGYASLNLWRMRMGSFCLPSLGKHSRSRSAPGTYLVLTAFSLVSLLHGRKVFEFFFWRF